MESNSLSLFPEFNETRSKALAFLMTTGSKALMLSNLIENNQISDYIAITTENTRVRTLTGPPVTSEKVLGGLTEEQAAKISMLHENHRRYLLLAMNSKHGCQVIKYSRSGYMRFIYLRVKRKPNEDYLCWRSRLRRYKYFSLSNVMIESPDYPENGTNSTLTQVKSTSNSSIRNGESKIEEPSLSTDRMDYGNSIDSTCRIKIRNNSRSLELWFRDKEQAVAFQEWLQLSYIDPRARGVTMPAHEESILD